MLQNCPHCQTRVEPGADGLCPACRRDTRPTAAAEPAFVSSRVSQGDMSPSVIEAEVVEPPPSEFEQSVMAELEKIRNPKGNWAQAVLVLIVSLVLFVSLGMRNNPIAFTVTLVGVLFFHELGHYLGMRAFGYRNVRMFFIPFFGAAVSGRQTDAKGYQEAIVTLLGPMPGLCLAVMLLIVTMLPGIDAAVRGHLLSASILLGLLNAFNLLPVYPLDGGRLLNQVLFARNRYVEGVFQALAALAFIAYGATCKEYFMLFLGVMFLLGVAPGFKMSTIALRIRGLMGGQLPPPSGPIPLAFARAVIEQMKSLLPALKTPKSIAGVVSSVWDKVHTQPPGAAATVALLGVYLFGVLLSLAVMILPALAVAARFGR